MCRSAATRRTSVRIVEVLAGVAVASLALGLGDSAASAASVLSAASAASVSSVSSVLTATSLSAPQGGTITISGNVSVGANCPSGAAVQLTSTPAQTGENLFASGLGPQVPRDASGNFQATFVIPASTPVGSYAIGVRCGDVTVSGTETLNVTAGPHTTPSITVSPASARPGDSVVIAGVVPTTGTVFCPSGDATQLTSTAALFPPDGFGPTVPRDASGNFRATYAIPASTTPGTFRIGVRCGGGNVGIGATLQVAAATAATTTTTTATTTTTTTAPTASSTSTPATLLAPTTSVPVSTTVSPPVSTSKKSKSNNKPLRLVALGVLVLVVLVGAVSLIRHGRSSSR